MGFVLGLFAGLFSIRTNAQIIVVTATRIRRGSKWINEFLINTLIDKVLISSQYHLSIFPLKIKNNKYEIISNMVDCNKYSKFNTSKIKMREKFRGIMI